MNGLINFHELLMINGNYSFKWCRMSGLTIRFGWIICGFLINSEKLFKSEMEFQI